MATFDLYVSCLPLNQAAGLKIFSCGQQPIGITGFSKTIDQFTKALLTETGSDITDPTYGTVLASLIGGNISGQSDLQDIIITSVQVALSKIQSYQAQNLSTPAEEKLASATVTAMAIDTIDSKVDFTVTLTNTAGTSVDHNFPTGIVLANQ